MLKKAPHISKNYCKKYQISPHGLNLLQRLSSKLLYDVVVIARGLRHSREPVSHLCRVNAYRLLCCSQLLLETVNLCLQLLRQVTIRDSLLAYDSQLLTNPFHEHAALLRVAEHRPSEYLLITTT